MGADTEALQERGRRLGREAGEVLVVRRDFLSQGKPATGKRPEGVLGGCGGRIERARSEGGAAREQTVTGEGVEGFSQGTDAPICQDTRSVADRGPGRAEAG